MRGTRPGSNGKHVPPSLTRLSRIAEQQGFLETLLATAPYCIAVLKGRDLRYTLTNPAYEAMTGGGADMVGRTYREIFPDLAGAGAEARLLRVLDTGEPWIIDQYRAPVPGRPNAIWQGTVVRLPLVPDEEPSALVIAWDDSEKVQFHQAVQDREALLNAFFSAAPGILILFDEDLRYLNMDPGLPAYFGVEREDLLGKSVKELDPWFYEQYLASAMREVRETGRPVALEVSGPVPGRAGEIGHFRASFFQVPLPGGRKGFGWVALDITDLKCAEAALKENEERFRTMADNIAQFAWMADPSGWIFWYNQRWYSYTGTTFEAMQGWGWQSVHHPDHVDRVVAKFRQSIENGEPWEDTFPLRGKDGEYRWFLSRALPIRDGQGKVLRWFGTNTDVTEYLATQAALERSEKRERERAAELEAIMDAAPAAIFTAHGRDARVAIANRAGYELLRMPPGTNTSKSDGAPEKPTHFTLSRDGRELDEDELPVQMAARTGQAVRNAGVDVVFEDGTMRHIFGNAVPLLSPEGDCCGAIGAFLDVTEQKRTEAALRRSNENLQQFAYAASHDLQEPLRTIMSFSQLLERGYAGNMEPKAAELVNMIVGAAGRMETLLSDLLTYTRTSTDKTRRVKTDATEALQVALKNLQSRINDSAAEIHHEPLPVVLADQVRLTQVFQNIISNSLKYRKPGERPVVTVSSRKEAGEWVFTIRDNGMGFTIRDNGMGFRPEHRDRIFGLFKRLHGTAIPGTGIGLALCKTIIEQQGGRIWAEGEEGVGAAVHFTLPVLPTTSN